MYFFFQLNLFIIPNTVIFIYIFNTRVYIYIYTYTFIINPIFKPHQQNYIRNLANKISRKFIPNQRQN